MLMKLLLSPHKFLLISFITTCWFGVNLLTWQIYYCGIKFNAHGLLWNFHAGRTITEPKKIKKTSLSLWVVRKKFRSEVWNSHPCIVIYLYWEVGAGRGSARLGARLATRVRFLRVASLVECMPNRSEFKASSQKFSYSTHHIKSSNTCMKHEIPLKKSSTVNDKTNLLSLISP